MKKTWHYILLIVAVGLAVFMGYEMFQAWNAGKRAIVDLILSPWRALKAALTGARRAVSTAAGDVAGVIAPVIQLPGLTQTELQNAQAQGSLAASYQPGGTIYKIIQATQGQAAADRAADAAAQNAANELAQAKADASWWGFGNLYTYL
jgi:hypothetical protein